MTASTVALNNNARLRRVRRALPPGCAVEWEVRYWLVLPDGARHDVPDLDDLEIWSAAARAAARLGRPLPPFTASAVSVPPAAAPTAPPEPVASAPTERPSTSPLAKYTDEERAALIARLRERQRRS